MNISVEDMYDYNYINTVSSIPVEEVVPVSIIYSITLLLGVVGNSLVIFCILKYQRMRSITNILLLSLASADLLLVLICVPIKGIAFLSFTWTMGPVLCKAVHYLQNVSMLCSVFTLTVISVERYIAIRHPLKARYICTLVHARVVILSVWLLSFICSIPILFGQQHIEVGYRRIGYYCLKEWSKQFYSKFYELYMLILMLVIPSVIMTVAYLGICQEMWNVTYRRADMRSGSMAENGQVETNTPTGTGFRSLRISGNTKRKKKNTTVEDDKTKMQVVKMLVVVVLLFIICWAPILINNVLVGFQHLDPLNYGYLKPMRIVFNIMAYFNSCINPIVYSFMSKNFRETFKHLFRSIFRGRFINDRKRTGRSTVSFATRSTSLNRSKMYSVKDPDKETSNSSLSENCKVTLVPNTDVSQC